MAEGWIVITQDRRLPMPGGSVIWDAAMPGDLLVSSEAAGSNWVIHQSLSSALVAFSLWAIGQPSRALRVSSPTAIESDSNGLALTRLQVLFEARDADVMQAIDDLSARFGACREEMRESQSAWRRALFRIGKDPDAVREALRHALQVRGLEHWSLQWLESADTVWDAWEKWTRREPEPSKKARDAWMTHVAFLAKWHWHQRFAEPSTRWRAWEPWMALPKTQVFDQQSPRFHADMRASFAARVANFALTLHFAAHSGWIDQPPDFLTRGIRDAFEQGLEAAFPIGPHTLGWAMADWI